VRDDFDQKVNWPISAWVPTPLGLVLRGVHYDYLSHRKNKKRRNVREESGTSNAAENFAESKR